MNTTSPNTLAPVRIGIMGLGFMAATHIKAYRQTPGAEVRALCSPSGRRLDGNFSDVGGNIGTAEQLQLDMTGVQAHRSFDAMLKDPEIDLIDICAPTPVHAPLAIAALRAGKHVICEKPMARDSHQARMMIETAQASGRRLFPAMCLRFWPEWNWLYQQIQSRKWGTVLTGMFRRLAEPPAWGHHHFLDGKNSGGALFDLHIHDIDFVCHAFGTPSEVSARGCSRISGAIDHVVAQLRTADGAMLTVEGSWMMSRGFGFNMSYLVNFEEATVDYDFSRGKEALKIHQNGKSEIVSVEGADGYVNEMRHFVECIRDNKQSAMVSAEQAITAIQICEAEERSIRGSASAFSTTESSENAENQSD